MTELSFFFLLGCWPGSLTTQGSWLTQPLLFSYVCDNNRNSGLHDCVSITLTYWALTYNFYPRSLKSQRTIFLIFLSVLFCLFYKYWQVLTSSCPLLSFSVSIPLSIWYENQNQVGRSVSLFWFNQIWRDFFQSTSVIYLWYISSCRIR